MTSHHHPHRVVADRVAYPPKSGALPAANDFPKVNNLRSTALLAAVQLSEPVPLEQAKERAAEVIEVAQRFEAYLTGR